jgi:putative endonuclease
MASSKAYSTRAVIPSTARNLLSAQVRSVFLLSAPMKRYWVYILASKSRTLYARVTNDLTRRLHEHRTSTGSEFTSKYRVTRLVHCEETSDIRVAIAREKEIKGWNRKKKIALIEATNPLWEDLVPAGETADSSLRSE